MDVQDFKEIYEISITIETKQQLKEMKRLLPKIGLHFQGPEKAIEEWAGMTNDYNMVFYTKEKNKQFYYVCRPDVFRMQEDMGELHYKYYSFSEFKEAI